MKRVSERTSWVLGWLLLAVSLVVYVLVMRARQLP